MIKIIVLLMLSTLLFSNAVDECKTDIWFGNGVWNSKDNARYSMQYLKNHIVKPVLIGGDPAKRAKFLPMHMAYNKHVSWDLDLIETFYQMKESGQISQTGYFTLIDQLLSLRASSITNASLQQMRNIIDSYTTRTEADNQKSIWNAYYHTTLKHSHRLLLVSHSQGNLFANRVFENYIAPAGYGEYFANLQIASPADHIAAPSGSYVTNCIDPIINPLPGSMSCNVNGFGHTLIGSYLDGGPDSFEAKNKIMLDLKHLANVLDGKPSQWHISQQPSDRTQCQNIRVSMTHRFDSALASISGVYLLWNRGINFIL